MLLLAEGLRLSRRHRAWLYGVGGALLVSGAAWLVLHHFLQREGEFGPEPHPLEPWSLRLHGAAAMGLLLILGTLLRGHVRVGWNRGVNRLSGGIVVAVLVVLVTTSWGLYYCGADDWRARISLLHWAVGLAAPLILLAHVVTGRRRVLRRR